MEKAGCIRLVGEGRMEKVGWIRHDMWARLGG
jgi:hypothetical protein